MANEIFRLSQADSQLIALDILFYAALVIFLLSQRKYLSRIKSGYNYLIIALMITFSVFSFYDSDWFSYYAIYNSYDIIYNQSFDFSLENLFRRGENGHMETIYYLFAKYSMGNYLLFRLFIWGGAVLFLALIAKRLEINKTAFYIIFVTCFLLLFCYGRVSLAYSLAFLGFSFIIKPFSKRTLSIVLGLVIIGISFVLHKSALFTAPLFILSFIPLKKNSIPSIILLAIPIIIVVYYLSAYVYTIDAGDNLALSTLQNQLDKTTDYTFSGSFIRNLISKYLVYLPFYFFFFGIISKANRGELNQCPKYILQMASAACWIIFMSTILLIGNQYLMFYRFILYSMIPITITLSYFYIHSVKIGRLTSLTMYSGLLFSVYKLAYVFYLSIV